jgi:hypothetical protein
MASGDRQPTSWRFRAGLLAAGAALFVAMAPYLRQVERAVAAGAGVRDQLDAGRLRPAADVARAVAAMKLVTVEVETSATAEREHESWRGDVRASVTAPARVLFGVDLSRLDAHRVWFSPASRAYLVRVPAPERVATEVDGGQETARVEVGWLRARSIAGEYWLGQARRGLYDEARRLSLSPGQAEMVRERTREQVASLVARVVGPGAGVRVVFEDE